MLFTTVIVKCFGVGIVAWAHGCIMPPIKQSKYKVEKYGNGWQVIRQPIRYFYWDDLGWFHDKEKATKLAKVMNDNLKTWDMFITAITNARKVD